MLFFLSPGLGWLNYGLNTSVAVGGTFNSTALFTNVSGKWTRRTYAPCEEGDIFVLNAPVLHDNYNLWLITDENGTVLQRSVRDYIRISYAH